MEEGLQHGKQAGALLVRLQFLLPQQQSHCLEDVQPEPQIGGTHGISLFNMGGHIRGQACDTAAEWDPAGYAADKQLSAEDGAQQVSDQDQSPKLHICKET